MIYRKYCQVSKGIKRADSLSHHKDIVVVITRKANQSNQSNCLSTRCCSPTQSHHSTDTAIARLVAAITPETWLRNCLHGFLDRAGRRAGRGGVVDGGGNGGGHIVGLLVG